MRATAVAAVILWATSVQAQSAGETTLFLLTGRDGLEFGPTGVAVIEDATVPCVGDARLTCRCVTSIKRLAPCRYETDSTGSGGPDETFDLGMIVDFG